MGANYEIVNEQQFSRVEPDNTLVDVIRVFYKTVPHGALGWVDIDKVPGWSQAIAATVGPEAAELEAGFAS